MTRLLVILALLAALAGVLALAWPGGDRAYDEDPYGFPTEEGPAGERGARTEDGEAALEGTGRVETGARREPKWPVLPTDKIPRGGLDVLVYGPDLKLLPPNAARIRLKRVGAPFWAEPLGLEDPETGAHRFRDLPFGKVVVQVYGPHLLATEKEAEVPIGATREVEVFADRGGSIRFKAVLADETEPAWIQLELRSRRSNKPVRVVFHSVSTSHHGPPTPGTSGRVGPAGFVYAIPPLRRGRE